MAIPYGRQSINQSDIDAVAGVLQGDWLTTGPYVDALEREVAELSGTADTGQAVTVTSGTAALHVAYAGLGVGRGDEVVTTPLTFVATATCAAIHGAKIVFADISEDTGNLDPESAAAAVTSSTRVIAGVDYAGHPIDAPALAKVAHDAGAHLLEDAAHSIGGFLDGVPVGSLADVTTFSFFPTKNMTTAEGGAVVSTDAEVLTRSRDFKLIGVVRGDRMRAQDEGPWWYEMPGLGLNYRLPDVLAALGSNQLRRLDVFKRRRAQLFERYNEAFADVAELRTPSRRDGADPTWHLYPLRVLDGRRREVFETLRAGGVLVQVNYIPVYWQPYFADLGYRRGMCPVAEEYYEQEISLPMYADLTDSQQDEVIEKTLAALKGS